MNQHNFFGTDGIRTQVGTFPLTKTDISKLGYALANWLIQKSNKRPSIMIAHDPRPSSMWLKTTLLSTLLEYPISIIDIGLAPTPLVCWGVKNTDQTDVGLMITASHNEYEYNGIKIILKNNKITAQDKQMVLAFFYGPQKTYHYQEFGTYKAQPTIITDYLSYLKNKFNSLFLTGKKVLLDCAHGAMSEIAPLAFALFGAEVISLNAQPDGTKINSNCGSSYPKQAQTQVLAHQADIGFCFDGDGDRVVAIAADGTIRDGDDILALLLKNADYCQQSNVVGTIMSNQGLEDYLTSKNKQLTRTAVGDSHMFEHMQKNDLLLGAEPCGHILLRDHLAASDGLFVALQVANTCFYLADWHMNVIKKYPQVNVNIPYKQKINLENLEINNMITYYEEKLKTGRIVVRYSGTEPVLRIMVESPDQETANRILAELANQFKLLIQGKENYDKKNKTDQHISY